MKKSIIVLAMTLVLPLTALACTNFLVGKNASADGSTMISYAADSYGMYGFLHFAPAADWPEGAMREVNDWDTGRPLDAIPQISHTYSVVGNMNEHQVTIGETTWGGREALWDTVGVDYGSLIYIALERSKTAREAIEWMITLVNEYGYASEGESFSIGDPNEVWIMDLIGKGPGNKGANWVAVRVPDNAICAHANQARITTLPQGKAKLTKEQKRLQKKLNCVCHGDWMWDIRKKNSKCPYSRKSCSKVKTRTSVSKPLSIRSISADSMYARRAYGRSSAISAMTWTAISIMQPVRLSAIRRVLTKENICRFGSSRTAK